MSKTFKNPFAAAAVLLFAAHKNLQEVYVTSDGQGFTDGNKADDHAKILNDKDVQKFKRGFEATYQDAEDGEPSEIQKVVDLEDEKLRAQLLADYENLYGKKSPSNLSTAELTAEVAKKRDEAKGNAAVQNQDGADASTDSASNPSERELVVAKYKEVFGTDPGHNWRTETIQAKIDEAKDAK